LARSAARQPVAPKALLTPVALRMTATDGLWDVYFGVHRIASVDQRVQNEGR